MTEADLFFERLKTDVKRRLQEYRGVAGFHLFEPESNRRVDIGGDRVLAAGSTIKIPVLMELYRKAASGQFDLDQQYQICDDDQVGGSGVLQHMEGNVRLSFRDLAILMINLSDNIATNICIDCAGMEDVNSLMDQIGCKNTLLRRKMIDSEAVLRGDENISTARDMSRWLESLYHNDLENQDLCDSILAVLRKRKASPIREGINREVPIASKTGGLAGVRCEVALVENECIPYILSIMTAFGVDDDNSETISDVAGIVDAYMHKWESFTGYGRGL